MRNKSIEKIVEKFDASRDITIFFVGDSITEGARSTCPDRTYVALFASLLAERFKGRRVVRFDGKRHPTDDGELLPLLTYGEPIPVQDGADGTVTVVRSGIGGNTVRRMLNRKGDFICREVGGRTADLFIINVGINDALFKDKSKYVPFDVFGSDLGTLIDEIECAMPNSDIILVTPSYHDHGTTAESHLDPYADEMKRVAMERSIPVIDLHDAWMRHLVVGGENYGQGNWLSGVNGDCCHPGDEGHKAIAEILESEMFCFAKCEMK